MQFKVQAFRNQCLIDYQPSVYGFSIGPDIYKKDHVAHT